nr:hypothetical protein CFP56_32086 [Quercus suber]
MGNLGKKLKKSNHFPMPVTKLYSSLLNEGLIASVVPKSVTNLLEGCDPLKTCKFHYDAPGHSTEECCLFRHKIQSLIDSSALVFEGATQSKVATTMTFDAQGGKANAIIREEDDHPDPEDLHGYLDNLFVAQVDLGCICPKELKEQGSTGLPTAPYPYGVPYPSLLLNKGNPGSGISQSSGTTALDLLSVPLSMLLPILLKAKLVELMASEATQAGGLRSYQRPLVRARSAYVHINQRTRYSNGPYKEIKI